VFATTNVSASERLRNLTLIGITEELNFTCIDLRKSAGKKAKANGQG
jgi:hypothetical protein